MRDLCRYRILWRRIELSVATAWCVGFLCACEADLNSQGGRSADRINVEVPMNITVRSEAFESGQPIPVKYTEDGEDLSPPLSWDGLPQGTQELALICDDPDAPTPQPWVHWVLYKLAADVTKLPQGIPAGPTIEKPIKALQGKNSWTSGQTIGYRGPAPPKGHGTHHYHFQVYALDTKLDVKSGLGKQDLLNAMRGHVLASGELVGTYSR